MVVLIYFIKHAGPKVSFFPLEMVHLMPLLRLSHVLGLFHGCFISWSRDPQLVWPRQLTRVENPKAPCTRTAFPHYWSHYWYGGVAGLMGIGLWMPNLAKGQQDAAIEHPWRLGICSWTQRLHVRFQDATANKLFQNKSNAWSLIKCFPDL